MTMKHVSVLMVHFLVSVTAHNDADFTQAFQQFQTDFGKQYKNQEEIDFRFAIFSQNMLNISEMNNKRRSSVEAVFGVTQFSDLTAVEFKSNYLTYRAQKQRPESKFLDNSPTPDKVDWVAHGAVNPVRDQGRTGDAVKISYVQMIEGSAKASGKYPLIRLSVQQLMDCTTDANIEEYILKNGMESEENYKPGKPCGYDPSRIAVKVHSFGQIKTNEDDLRNQTSFRPVRVCVDARTFQTYRGGILTSCGTQINHCLELVGYDFAASTPYWRLQNMWGSSWGENGYIRIATGKDLCKIADAANFAVV